MKRTLFYVLLAIAIGVFFLVLTARELPFGVVVDYFRQADFQRIGVASVIFVVLYGGCHWARVLRWYYLIRPISPDVDSTVVARVCAVGFGAILVLPLRLGEFVRPVLLSRVTTVPVSAGLATAVVERVMDGLVITGLLFATLMTYQGDASIATIRAAGTISAVVFVPALIVCVSAYLRREWTMRWVRWVARFVPRGLGDKAAGMLEAFIDGLRSLVEGHALSRFLGLSALYWGLNAFSMWVLARYGFDLPIGLWDGLTMMSVLVVGIMIPAGPAMTGNFEYFVLQAAGLFVALEVFGGAVGAFAALLHILQFLVIVLPALWISAVDRRTRGWWRLAKERSESL